MPPQEAEVRKRYIVVLSEGERAGLHTMIGRGIAPASVLSHARILLKAKGTPHDKVAVHRGWDSGWGRGPTRGVDFAAQEGPSLPPVRHLEGRYRRVRRSRLAASPSRTYASLRTKVVSMAGKSSASMTIRLKYG